MISNKKKGYSFSQEFSNKWELEIIVSFPQSKILKITFESICKLSICLKYLDKNLETQIDSQGDFCLVSLNFSLLAKPALGAQITQLIFPCEHSILVLFWFQMFWNVIIFFPLQ